MLARRNRVLFTLMLSVAFVGLTPAILLGHAILVDSMPRAGAAVHGPNISVTLRFNVRVDGSRSRCTLISADGKSMPFALEPQQKADVLVGKLTGLRVGEYRLRWQVLAADGHISRGELTFVVT